MVKSADEGPYTWKAGTYEVRTELGSSIDHCVDAQVCEVGVEVSVVEANEANNRGDNAPATLRTFLNISES